MCFSYRGRKTLETIWKPVPLPSAPCSELESPFTSGWIQLLLKLFFINFMPEHWLSPFPTAHRTPFPDKFKTCWAVPSFAPTPYKQNQTQSPTAGAPSLPAESILMSVCFRSLSAAGCFCHLNFNFLIHSPDETERSRIRAVLYIGLGLSSVKFGALQTYSSDYLLRTSPAISISAAGW